MTKNIKKIIAFVVLSIFILPVLSLAEIYPYRLFARDKNIDPRVMDPEDRKREIQEAITEIKEIDEKIERETKVMRQKIKERAKENVREIIEEIGQEHRIRIAPGIVRGIEEKITEELKEKIEDLDDKAKEAREFREGARKKVKEKENIELRIAKFEGELTILEGVGEEELKRATVRAGIEIDLIAPEEIREGMRGLKRDAREALNKAREKRVRVVEELENVAQEKGRVEEKTRQAIEAIKKATRFEMVREIEKEVEERLEGDILTETKQKIRRRAEETTNQVMGLVKELEETVEKEREIQLMRIGEIERDTDGDGLSDKEEINLGTNIIDPDSDNDGFLDGVEVKHGFNPLSPAPEAGFALQDPREVSPEKIDVYIVENVETTILPDGRRGIKISGRGLPNSPVTVFIFSRPIIITVETDGQGKWSYVLEDPLQDGKHEAYVAIANNRGEIEARSSVFPFILAGEGEHVAALPHIAKIAAAPIEEIKRGYLVLTFLIAVLGIIAGLIIVQRFSKKKKGQERSEKNRSR